MLNLTSMLALPAASKLNELLSAYDAIDGVLDYVPRTVEREPSHAEHARSAIAAMQLIDRNLERWAIERSTPDIPIEMFYRLTIDSDKLDGQIIDFDQFWGTDDVAPKPLGDNAWSIPNVDGYKTAFFHPPYGIRGEQFDNLRLFDALNQELFGTPASACIVYNWSTNWSTYFDAGHEWWGSLFWTVYSPNTKLLTCIGASSTD